MTYKFLHSNNGFPFQNKNQFCSKNEFGALIGIGQMKDASDDLIRNPEWAAELTSTNGIRYEPWFVGIGIGVRSWGTDFTFPLFVNVSLDLWKSALFLHADLGYQFGTRKSNYRGDKETGNFYAAYGLGCNFAIKEPVRLGNLEDWDQVLIRNITILLTCFAGSV